MGMIMAIVQVHSWTEGKLDVENFNVASSAIIYCFNALAFITWPIISFYDYKGLSSCTSRTIVWVTPCMKWVYLRLILNLDYIMDLVGEHVTIALPLHQNRHQDEHCERVPMT